MSADAGQVLSSGRWQNRIFKPNESIEIADTRIVRIDGRHVDIPTRVIQELFPRPRLFLECSGVPPFASHEDFRDWTLCLDDGISLTAHLGSIAPGGSYTWVPTVQPCVVEKSPARLSSVDFVVINFRWFAGSQDLHLRTDDGYHRVSAFTFSADPWSIELTAVSGLTDILETIEKSAGYAVTHTGRIRRSDRSHFDGAEAEQVVRSLATFLSFLRGGRCGIALATGISDEDDEAWQRWGTGHVKRGNNSRYWLSGIHSEDAISDLFRGSFRRLVGADGRAVQNILDWYLNASESSYHAGLILIQAALERLSHLILDRPKGGREKTGDFIRDALSRSCLGVSASVPEALRELTDFAFAENIAHGPAAIVKVRNDLVHPRTTTPAISARTQLEASELAEYYVELILLKMFGYSGRHWNRIDARHEDVPWSSPVPVGS